MSAVFVRCPSCHRLMLGQRSGQGTFPQPHDCERTDYGTGVEYDVDRENCPIHRNTPPD